MNILDNISKLVKDVIIEAVKVGELSEESAHVRFTVEATANRLHGDFAVNAAMVLAPVNQMKPRDIAVILFNGLIASGKFKKVEVAGPGFINIVVLDTVWSEMIRYICDIGAEYGACNEGEGCDILVEFVSANPTGPMHAGHIRGAVIGDVITALLRKIGYKVTGEFYVNDAGSQIDTLLDSAYLRYLEALGQDITISAGLYPGDYLCEVGRMLVDKYGPDLTSDDLSDMATRNQLKRFVVDAMMVIIRRGLDLLRVKHDVFVFESELCERGAVERVVELLQQKNMVYKGIPPPPKGTEFADKTNRERVPLLLFKSSELGDTTDRSLSKTDNSFTYFACDIAYHFSKYERGFTRMINILGKDHVGYEKRITSAVSAISDGKAHLKVVFYDLVRFLEKGVPTKMSKRSGNFIDVELIVKKVGLHVTRFIMASQHTNLLLDFDFAKVQEQSKDNPIFYINYAYVRINSMLRKAKDVCGAEILTLLPDASVVYTAEDIALLRHLSLWPSIVRLAADKYEPCYICAYMKDLAALFHALWNAGNDREELRFVVEDKLAVTIMRVSLARAAQYVLQSGFDLLGITPVESM